MDESKPAFFLRCPRNPLIQGKWIFNSVSGKWVMESFPGNTFPIFSIEDHPEHQGVQLCKIKYTDPENKSIVSYTWTLTADTPGDIGMVRIAEHINDEFEGIYLMIHLSKSSKNPFPGNPDWYKEGEEHADAAAGPVSPKRPRNPRKQCTYRPRKDRVQGDGGAPGDNGGGGGGGGAQPPPFYEDGDALPAGVEHSEEAAEDASKRKRQSRNPRMQLARPPSKVQGDGGQPLYDDGDAPPAGDFEPLAAEQNARQGIVLQVGGQPAAPPTEEEAQKKYTEAAMAFEAATDRVIRLTREIKKARAAAKVAENAMEAARLEYRAQWMAEDSDFEAGIRVRVRRQRTARDPMPDDDDVIIVSDGPSASASAQPKGEGGCGGV